MNPDSVSPQWVSVRSKVAILEPFPVEFDALPSLPQGTWLGRVIYDYDFNCIDGFTKANAWICNDRDFDYKNLHFKARNQTRKAEKEGAKVSKVDWEKVSKLMPDLVLQTFKRQGRDSANIFLSYLARLRELDDSRWNRAVDLWVVEKDGVVGALIIGLKYRTTYHILHQLSQTRSLSWCPNNFLTFTVTKYALKELMCDHVNYGVDGLDQQKLDGLFKFKTRMGYKLLPCKEHFIGRPRVLLCIKYSSLFSEFMLRAFPFLSRIDTLRMLAGLGRRI